MDTKVRPKKVINWPKFMTKRRRRRRRRSSYEVPITLVRGHREV